MNGTRPFRHAALGAALLLCAAAPATGQDCEIVRSLTASATNAGTPQQIATVTGAVISCPGGKRLAAGTAISSEMTGIIELIGNVEYSDAERSLTAGRAQYYKRDGRIIAVENAVVRDRKTGSVIRGQRIDYTQAAGSRPAYMQVQPSTPRPTALLVQREGTTEDTTNIEADMLELFGEDRFRATGGVIMRRDSLNGFSGIMEYDQATGAMEFVVQARIETSQYSLVGDTVRALVQRDTIRQVTSHGNAVLTTTDVNVQSPYLFLGLQGGELQRMVAVGQPASRGLAVQAKVQSEQFRLQADSIDVLAPGQQLDRLFAVGRAYGEVVDTLPPIEIQDGPQDLLATDWMRGDTVQAFFAVNPKAATDTAADERVLERVVTSGKPASSLYRRREAPQATPAGQPAAPPAYSIGYLLARRIEVALVEGEVTDVKATDDVRGVYLQPRTAASTQARRNTDRNR